ncbi:MAG: tyrosine-type recombinase/integrase [Thaumarchaeota archaeon]|nr:tyrosine-type recombinase/integrase [Nitrososphaerota archaeon]
MSRANEIYPLDKLLKREELLIGKDRCNAESLSRYFKVISTQVAQATLLYTSYKLRALSKMLNKKFEHATIKDIEELHYNMCQRWKNPNTRNKHRKLLKKFYQWLKGCNEGEYPELVKWIKTERVPLVSVTTDDLISYDEALRICDSTRNLRDRTLFSCLLDAGCRIGEILPARLNDVRITETGAIINSDGKTGRQPLILTWSTPVLATWLNNHPFREIANAPLFPGLGRRTPRVLQYWGAKKALKESASRAGIKKRVWLHLFKHVSSTEDAMNGMPDSFRRYKHHWTQSSKMPAVYEHLSQSIIPKIQQEAWRNFGVGVKPDKGQAIAQTKTEVVSQCMKCRFENPRDSTCCNRCGFALDPILESNRAVAIQKVESLMMKLTEDPKKVEKLLALIEE